MSVPPESDLIHKTIEDCKLAHQADTYFDNAEPYMDRQWERFIQHRISAMDFTRVLELAPGHGRNTARLIPLSREIHLVDVNQSCIDKCKKRFETYAGPCKLLYHVNDGQSLAGIPSHYFTFIYSWDAMVHFDRLVIRQYVKEFSRVMTPGAKGFVHHSNYGVISQNADWQSNPAWRSNMTRNLFVEYANEAGLRMIQSDLIPWDGKPDLDCISIFQKR